MELLLVILIFLPLTGAVMILGSGNDSKTPSRIALATSIITLALTFVVMYGFFSGAATNSTQDGFRLVTSYNWIGGGDVGILGKVDIKFFIGLDGISIWLVVLTSLLTPIVVLSSFSSIKERTREYYAFMLILQTGMTGVFCSLDLLLFYVFFEFTLIPLFLLIGIWGGPQRKLAANKFFIYTVAGSVLTFAGILYVSYYVYTNTDIGVLTFDLTKLYTYSYIIDTNVQWWLFLAFFAGFAIKVPLFPFHTWLPLAHTEAPTAGSVLLAGVLLKLGTYGFLRVSLALLPSAAYQLAPFMASLAIVGIIYGALVAWVQVDVKKLVAYSSVSHLGFCILGMFTLKMSGVSGSVIYMINHGLSTGALFLIVGMIYERYHTRDIHKIGGLARQMPVMSFFLVFFTLSSIGLPGLNGFVGEFLVLLGTALSGTNYDGIAPGPLGYAYAIPAASGIVLGAIYMLWMCQRVLFGPLVEPVNTPDLSGGLRKDLTRREISILVPLAIWCVLIGVYPKSIQSSIEPSILTNVFHKTTTINVNETNDLAVTVNDVEEGRL